MSWKNGKSKHGLLHMMIFTGILLGFQSPIKCQQSVPFRLELIVPVSTPDGHREITLDRYPQIHVIITNISDQTQRLWKDWNTWGYFNLSLSWQVGNRHFPIQRKAPDHWDGDFPDFWVLLPGESLILVIDMSTAEWDGFPDLYGERIPATLQAHYQNKADVLAEEFDVWVGKIESLPLEVVFK